MYGDFLTLCEQLLRLRFKKLRVFVALAAMVDMCEDQDNDLLIIILVFTHVYHSSQGDKNPQLPTITFKDTTWTQTPMPDKQVVTAC